MLVTGHAMNTRSAFPRSRRLLTAAQYRRVFQNTARRARREALMGLAVPNDLPHHRLGLAVAKKHVPTAVRRNLIKRLAREQFRHLKPGQSPLDIVILSRPAARSATREQLRQALEQLFTKLGLETSNA